MLILFDLYLTFDRKEILSISMVIAISMQLFWNFVKKSTKPKRGESISSETTTVDVDEVAGIAEELAVKIQQVPPAFKSRLVMVVRGGGVDWVPQALYTATIFKNGRRKRWIGKRTRKK